MQPALSIFKFFLYYFNSFFNYQQFSPTVKYLQHMSKNTSEHLFGLHEFRPKDFSGRTFGPKNNFFYCRIESPSLWFSFHIGPKFRAEKSLGRNSVLPFIFVFFFFFFSFFFVLTTNIYSIKYIYFNLLKISLWSRLCEIFKKSVRESKI
jgi:hypothetical protein